MTSARGLFRRAIAHSVPGLYSTPASARQVTAAFADRLGAAAPTAEALRDIDPWQLAAELTSFNAGLHAHRESWGRLTEAGTALCPVIDGEVLPETPYSGTSVAVFHMPSQNPAEANAVAGSTSYLLELCWSPRSSAAFSAPATASTRPWRSARWTAPSAPSSPAR